MEAYFLSASSCDRSRKRATYSGSANAVVTSAEAGMLSVKDQRIQAVLPRRAGRNWHIISDNFIVDGTVILIYIRIQGGMWTAHVAGS